MCPKQVRQFSPPEYAELEELVRRSSVANFPLKMDWYLQEARRTVS